MKLLICSDVLEYLKTLDENSIDLALTDPPYFLDKMDNYWKPEIVSSKKYHHVITSLPAGMKFDKDQGKKFYTWYSKISQAIHRVLKPGAFFFSFSSPRLYHRMTCAIEDAGFLIKDQFIWLYTQSQPKAMSLNHFINKMKDKEKKKQLTEKVKGWKTPQVKSCFEPVAMGQKPPEGTLLNNFDKWGVGLFNMEVKLGDEMFASNCMTDEEINPILDKYFLTKKPNKKEKGDFNNHKTVKPLSICEYLIRLTTNEDAIVLDPFVGSGTTVVAANNLKRDYIGIDINEEYIEIANKRLL